MALHPSPRSLFCLQGCGVATFSKPFEAEAAMRALGECLHYLTSQGANNETCHDAAML